MRLLCALARGRENSCAGHNFLIAYNLFNVSLLRAVEVYVQGLTFLCQFCSLSYERKIIVVYLNYKYLLFLICVYCTVLNHFCTIMREC